MTFASYRYLRIRKQKSEPNLVPSHLPSMASHCAPIHPGLSARSASTSSVASTVVRPIDHLYSMSSFNLPSPTDKEDRALGRKEPHTSLACSEPGTPLDRFVDRVAAREYMSDFYQPGKSEHNYSSRRAKRKIIHRSYRSPYQSLILPQGCSRKPR